ncbi:hypothetical protein GCM10009639_51790 [Kitasatospora putterlickiae]|uniref:Uncharacterized protein n=1 Tax=Kitasatospora putterlickiae TaxID=221725 RepID=A0ABP4J5E6_9ACTN
MAENRRRTRVAAVAIDPFITGVVGFRRSSAPGIGLTWAFRPTGDQRAAAGFGRPGRVPTTGGRGAASHRCRAGGVEKRDVSGA